MKELLCIGEEIFEVGICEDEGGSFGVGINAPAIVKGERVEGVGILYTWFGLWNKLGCVGTDMKKLNFIIQHPLKFNRLFRKFLSKHPEGKRIVKTYNEELEWKRKLRDWKKK